jgi:hypothetical protein
MAVLNETAALFNQLKVGPAARYGLCILAIGYSQGLTINLPLVQGAVGKNDLQSASRLLNSLKVTVLLFLANFANRLLLTSSNGCSYLPSAAEVDTAASAPPSPGADSHRSGRIGSCS